MASLIFARPGKVSERLYLGDLACLFDRQRRRSGLALTLDSFAGDLAASDSLRSALFTLCTAISHMGENDLSPEELLDLVVRALSGAGSAEGESGAEVPAEMRDAFLSAYAAWQARGLEPIPGLSGQEDPHQGLPDGVLPFPSRRSATAEFSESAGLQFAELSARRRAAAKADPQSAGLDDRPHGIDALLAAAPAWANATPPARGSMPDASIADSPNTPLVPAATKLLTSLNLADDSTVPPQPGAGVQAFLQQIPPRKVFFALAGLTVLAGALAGVMAYRTLHSGQALPSENPEPTIALAATSEPTSEAPAYAPSSMGTTTNSVQMSNTSKHPAPLANPRTPAIAEDAQTTASTPLDIPAPTMIGYALATPQPAYSAARSFGVTGTVAVNIVVSRLGDVISADAVSGPQQFYAASVRAVRGWHFRPYLVDGQPVEVATTLQFAF